LLFNSALEYAIKRVQENPEGPKLHRTHQLLAYADDINIVGEDIDTTQKTTEASLNASQKIGQKHSIKLVNRSFEDVEKFKYLGTLADQNCMHKEINSRPNSGNTCYHSVQRLSSSHLLSRNIKVKIYKTAILPVVLYGCET
jgi:sorting nexin-29